MEAGAELFFQGLEFFDDDIQAQFVHVFQRPHAHQLPVAVDLHPQPGDAGHVNIVDVGDLLLDAQGGFVEEGHDQPVHAKARAGLHLTRFLEPLDDGLQRFGLGPIVVEPDAGLFAQATLIEQGVEELDLDQPISVMAVQVFAHVGANVNAQHVHQEERPHGPAKAVAAQRLVNLLGCGCALFQGQHRLVEIGHQQPVDQKAGAFLDNDRDLAQLLGELLHGVNGILVGLGAGDDLDQFHHVGRVEKVHPDHPVGPPRGRAHLGDGQSRRVGSKDGVRRADLVQFAEHLLFDGHHLRHSLDDNVHILEIGVIQGVLDQVQFLLHLALGHFALVHPFLVDALHVPTGQFQLLLINILDHHRQAGKGDHLGNAPAHGPRTDHACFENPHRFSLLMLVNWEIGTLVNWDIGTPSRTCPIYQLTNLPVYQLGNAIAASGSSNRTK